MMKNKRTARIMNEWPIDVKPLVNFEKKIGLIWSAKSACSLSIIWFFAVTGHLKDAWAHSRWPHNYRGKIFNQIQFSSSRHSMLMSANTKWIRVMRDPFKRAVSSYRHFLRYDIEREEVNAFLGEPVSERGLSFEEFLAYLETRDINQCDIHFRQQWVAGEEFCLHPIVINADSSDIEAILFSILKPDDETIKIFNESRDWIFFRHVAKIRETLEIGSSTILRGSDIQDKWPGYSVFDNAKTREMVARIYHVDFERFAPFI